MAIADFVYQNNAVTWRVEILGKDVSEYVSRTNVGSIRHTLDNNFLTEFQVGDCQLSLSDEEGYFSQTNEENFFTENTWAASGYLSRIELYGGYLNPTTGASEETLVFKGVIISVTRDSKTGVVTVNASDNSEVNRQNVANFGLRQETLLSEASQRSIRGEYQFSRHVSPVADDSVSATLKGTNDAGTAIERPMTQKNVLDDFGELSEENFSVVGGADGSRLLTEEAVSDLTDASISADYATPHRYRHVTTNVRSIANYYNIQIAELSSADPQQEERFFASLGKLQARLAQETEDTEFTWRGVITDFLVDPDTNIIYLIICDRVSTILPRFVRYDPASDIVELLYQPLVHQEYWRLATSDFDTFYILNTTGTREQGLPVLASYNPSEWNNAAMPQTAVTRYVVSTSTPTEILNTGTATRPQIANFHFYGAQQERLGFVPDSRQNFTVARGVLWYRYANRTHFGLARYKESDGTVATEISIARDGRNNEAAHDFTIDETDNKIYGGHTAQTSVRSRILTYEKTLAASY